MANTVTFRKDIEIYKNSFSIYIILPDEREDKWCNKIRVVGGNYERNYITSNDTVISQLKIAEEDLKEWVAMENCMTELTESIVSLGFKKI